ncbi:MAG: universal stress protein [Acidimicrobiia bacterium]|nr:universal stress protein [Acidimicrobiia bacterium]
MKTIVVGTDGSPTAHKAVLDAAELALASGAHVHVVSAYRSETSIRAMSATAAVAGALPDGASALSGVLAGDAEQTATNAAKELADGDVSVESHAVPGDPADALLDVARAVDADVIVVGSKGMTGAKRFVLGSVPNKVAHHATCNVLIVYTS